MNRKSLLTKVVLHSILATAVLVPSVYAASNATNSTAPLYIETPGDRVLIGQRATAINQGAVAIGNATVNNIGAIAIGDTAVSGDGRGQMNNSIAIGSASKAVDQSSVALGHGAIATGNRGTALGASTSTGYYGTAVGARSKSNDQGVAVGSGADATGRKAVAIGSGAKALIADSIAIGQSSETTKGTESKKAEINGITYDGFVGYSGAGEVVSVGKAGLERQIQNVAAGQVIKTSTDAINGSQLYATNNVIGNVAKSVKDLIGGGVEVKSDGSINGDNINIGDTGKTNVSDAIKAIGDKANTNADSINQIVNYVNQQNDTIKSGFDALNQELAKTNDKVLDQGQKIDTNTANIDTLNKTVKDNVAHVADIIGGNATANADGTITGTDGDALNIASTGKSNISEAIEAARTTVASNKHTISVTDTEAEGAHHYNIDVNKGSLKVTDDGKVTAEVDDVTKQDNDEATADNSFVSAADIANAINTVAEKNATTNAGVANRLDALDQKVDAVDHKVNKLSDKMNKVGAGAAALAALHPLEFNPDDKWSFAAGYGNYSNANAVAVGAYYRPNENTMFSVAGTMGNGENMVNAGVAFKVGSGNSIVNSRVAMAKEITDLKDLVAKMAARLDMQDGKTTELPTTDRIRVDRVHGDDNARHKVDRVRVNDANQPEINEYRDVYGDVIPAPPVAVQEEEQQAHIVDLWAAINKK